MEEGLSLLFVFVLVLLNGFFVAAEFAVVKVRPTRVEQLIKEGNKGAKHVKKILDDLDAHLSGAQLGITLTSLGIGWLSEPSIASLLEKLLHPIIENEFIINSISVLFAFLFATFFHITIGEQVPKMLAIESSEKVSLRTALPLYWFCKITNPIIKVLKFSTNVMLRVLGITSRSEHEVHSEEEIKIILSNSPEIEPEEQQMFERILDFNDRLVREIMVHRKEMVCVYLQDPLEETLKVIKESNHSRFPVCGEDKDDVLGYINIRDLYDVPTENITLEQFIRKITRVYEGNTVPKALKQLQKGKHQIAIVIDEYGGVSGMITIEDIIEEIVGDIQDEFDDDEDYIDIQENHNGISLVPGSTLVDEIHERFGLELEEIDGIDTIAGHVMTIMEEPKVGTVIELENYLVRIEEMEGDRITLLQFTETAPKTQNENLEEVN